MNRKTGLPLPTAFGLWLQISLGAIGIAVFSLAVGYALYALSLQLFGDAAVRSSSETSSSMTRSRSGQSKHGTVSAKSGVTGQSQDSPDSEMEDPSSSGITSTSP